MRRCGFLTNTVCMKDFVAEIGEIMIANRTSPSRALKSVITAALQTNGDSRVAGKYGLRSWESSSPRPSAEDSGESSGCKESLVPVKEIRKLYGLLKLKSSNKIGQVKTRGDVTQELHILKNEDGTKVEYRYRRMDFEEFCAAALNELSVGPSVPVHAVLHDWIRHTDGKLSFLGFVKLLHGVSSRSLAKAQ